MLRHPLASLSSFASVAALVVFLLGAAPAAAFSDVYAFGASSLDSGATAHLLGGYFCPDPPYADCRFSNGPTWVENLASAYGRSADTAYAPGGGTNYAIGGQRSDQLLAGPAIFGGGQIPRFATDVSGVADADALYVIKAGANNYFQNDPPGTFLPEDAAADVVQGVSVLADLGAVHFLVSSMAFENPWADAFNVTLLSGLAELRNANSSLEIFEFDTRAIQLAVTLDPTAYGLTNLTDRCYDATAGTVCANPDEYMLWDSVHPTARGHEILAEAALRVIPEPSTALLMALGLSLLGSSRRSASR
jgi:phospholipase/lecithinase/hemolysin